MNGDRLLFFLLFALLKLNVNFDPMVIGAEKRDSCGKSELKETLQAKTTVRRIPNRPLKSERLERKSTGKINRANCLSLFVPEANHFE
jgi:hypothetical protein